MFVNKDILYVTRQMQQTSCKLPQTSHVKHITIDITGETHNYGYEQLSDDSTSGAASVAPTLATVWVLLPVGRLLLLPRHFHDYSLLHS